MKNKSVEISFKKLLGNGRAWSCPVGFTAELLEVLVSPLSELKERFVNLKYSHFPSFHQDINNIVNDEELFGIKGLQDKTLEERASTVEAQWNLLSGSLNWKPLKEALNKASLNVEISENLPAKPVYSNSVSLYGSYSYNQTLKETKDFIRYGEDLNRKIGNGNIDVEGRKYDPCVLSSKTASQYGSFGYGSYNSDVEAFAQYGIRGGSRNCFFITSDEPITAEQYELLTKIVLQKKPAQSIAICNIQVIN